MGPEKFRIPERVAFGLEEEEEELEEEDPVLEARMRLSRAPLPDFQVHFH